MQHIANSIRIYNRGRELMKQLYELRKRDRPPVTGAEALEVSKAAARMPRERFNELMEQLLDEIQHTGREIKKAKRLMVIGNFALLAGLHPDDVEEYLGSLRERFASLKRADRPVADGDFVTLFGCTVDGQCGPEEVCRRSPTAPDTADGIPINGMCVPILCAAASL